MELQIIVILLVVIIFPSLNYSEEINFEIVSPMRSDLRRALRGKVRPAYISRTGYSISPHVKFTTKEDPTPEQILELFCEEIFYWNSSAIMNLNLGYTSVSNDYVINLARHLGYPVISWDRFYSGTLQVQYQEQDTSSMAEDSRQVSLRLWDVLENVGVSEHMRQLYRETAIHEEILDTVTFRMTGNNLSFYRFGSSSEGTQTPGMSSDCDIVQCFEIDPVVDDNQQAPPSNCFLMTVSRHTKPGYVKLQIVKGGVPLTCAMHICSGCPEFMIDCEGKACLMQIQELTDLGAYVTERNGPADSITGVPGYTDTDFVYALRSRTFPPAATDSLFECIRSGWLTRDDVEKMISFGCLFVGVGHPHSEEKDIEWRISFSLQERYIMFSLNATQHKCYVLLKPIKIMLTSKPEVEKSITSYHCKTCLFRVIMKTNSDLWVPVNLIECTLICLTEMRQCLFDGNLPNFFIKRNNMFEHRISREVTEKLIYYISSILNDGIGVFYMIQSDNIGHSLMCHACRNRDINFMLGRTIYEMYKNVNKTSLFNQKKICLHLERLSHQDTSLYLFHQLRYLASVDTINEHTQDETKNAITHLETLVHKLYALHLASEAFSTEVQTSRPYLLQACARHLRQGMIWDLMSGRLLYATILYKQGNIELCCDLLYKIEQNLCKEVISLCGCHDFVQVVNISLMRKIQREQTDPHSIMKSYVATCTIFLPSHSVIIPTALQYEMYRSVGAPPGLQTISYSGWYSWCVTDSKTYLYFLQYLVYSHQNKHRAKQRAIENLRTVLQEDYNIGHRETGYNLLGWIYSQEGQIETAAKCFLYSWKLIPHYNAAEWHMLNLMYQQFLAKR